MDRELERDQDQPKLHGDPLRREIVEDSDRPDRDESPVADADGEKRREHYDEGADLVSDTD